MFFQLLSRKSLETEASVLLSGLIRSSLIFSDDENSLSVAQAQCEDLCAVTASKREASEETNLQTHQCLHSDSKESEAADVKDEDGIIQTSHQTLSVVYELQLSAEN